MNGAKYQEFLKNYEEHVATSDYKSILLPNEPYEDGRECYFTQYGSVTDQTILEYESKYGVKLPEDLKNLLKLQNGGHVHEFAPYEECAFDSICSLTLDTSEDRWLFAMIPVYDWLELRGDVEDDEDLANDKEELERFIILDGDGHHFLALDYRGGEECKGVVSVSVEGGYYGAEEICTDFKSLFSYW
ncbi:SMI1 / KNR4 family (SUKH-1) [Rubritalea squalenifaciens DSM 18772]|uniref:SMI1 / KNR4 family (SUKH-1) n=1 Tax=Rubritalea squalenifaciens DSM 18772 TaxID=1123071 RepID=A0A1M6QMA3_9BACT|nr:SMI1 / KNR4 family (SUKH-1) [Rubritalea squalenifaciens DSM 18772]